MPDEKNDDKVIRNWPHMRFTKLEVAPGPIKASIRMAPPIWAHFFDLVMGAGQFKISENATHQETRSRALAALRSAWPAGYEKMAEAFKIDEIGPGVAGFVVIVDASIPTSVTA